MPKRSRRWSAKPVLTGSSPVATSILLWRQPAYHFPDKREGPAETKLPVFSISIDDSTDGLRKKIFVVAGFLGDSQDWFEVERLWEKRVEDEGLLYFRATECFSLTGQFNELVKKYGPTQTREKTNVLLEDLKLIIKASDLHAFCLGCLSGRLRNRKK